MLLDCPDAPTGSDSQAMSDSRTVDDSDTCFSTTTLETVVGCEDAVRDVEGDVAALGCCDGWGSAGAKVDAIATKRQI